MMACTKCAREMEATLNGLGLDYGNGHVYSADEWTCPDCGAVVAATNARPMYDPDHTQCERYVDMAVRHD
jgi:hypothetical protein